MPDVQPILVRPARPADADRVWQLARAFATSSAPERAAYDRTWQPLVEAPGTLVAVAEVGGTVVGYLLAGCRPTFHANGPVAWVEEVMVDEDHRRSGVGRTLMGYVEHWARDEGAAYVALASRRAGPFYRALGYEDSAVFFKKQLDERQ